MLFGIYLIYLIKTHEKINELKLTSNETALTIQKILVNKSPFEAPYWSMCIKFWSKREIKVVRLRFFNQIIIKLIQIIILEIYAPNYFQTTENALSQFYELLKINKNILSTVQIQQEKR